MRVPLDQCVCIMSKIPRFRVDRYHAVAIASSTGGPSVVEEILAGLPADLPVPIFLAQHMPPSFTESFAAQLDRASPLSVIHAEDGMPIFPGVVYVGVGHQHMRVRRIPGGQARIEISPEPQELVYKPSGDEIFRSCATLYGNKTLAVVLTGIGRDGTEGAQAIHDAGGMVISQSAQTCAVYGMPKSCTEAGVSKAQLDPLDIRRCLLQLSPNFHSNSITCS